MDVGAKFGQSSVGRISATNLSKLEWAFGKHGDIVVALVGIVTGLMYVVLFVTQRKKLRLPQGPRSLPIIGNIHQLGNDAHTFLWQEAKKYGPIMYLRLGSQGFVVASSAEAAREFVKVQDKVWAGRESSTSMDMFSYNHLDIAGAPYGPYWLHLRKICTMELFTTKCLELFRPPRTDEFNQMIKSIMDDVEQGKIVDLAMKLRHVAMNNITRMLLNKRFYGVDASEQHKAYKFKELTFNLLKLLTIRSIGDFVPWLKWVIIVSGLKSRMMKVKARADVVLQEFLEVKKNGKIINVKNDDVHCEDFVDVLMAQPAEDGTGHLSDNSIKAVIQDMLLAGTDTTANTVEWAIAELLRHPHCAKKLQTELDEVVGKDRIVTESDIPNLPYLNAVVKEVLRLHPAAPLSVTHVALEDTTVGGFDFVAGTRLCVNIYAIQRDPKWWERPLEFDPERFIKNPEINPLGSHFQFIPFGTGRRQCPGMLLALLFVQVGLARLMQSFDFALPNGQDPATLDMTEKFGVTLPRQNPLQVVCKPRLPKHFYKGA
jgi:cytochrome P450